MKSVQKRGVGYHLAGIPGALLCVFGISFPPLVTLSVITFFYTQFRENAVIKAALSGIRAAVAPIILCAALRMMKSAYRYRLCIAITAASLFTVGKNYHYPPSNEGFNPGREPA